MSFEENIKEWVTIDNKIKQLNEQTKALRKQRNNISESINMYVETNDLKHATVQISDGKLKFQSVKVTQPLTLKYVNECLLDCIGNEDQVKEIMKHIKTNRDSKYVEDIKRFYS